MQNFIKPIPLAMIFADFMYKDRGNGKLYIIGMFRNIFAKAFPIVLESMWIFQQFTDFTNAPITASIEMKYLDEDYAKILRLTLPLNNMQSPDKLGITEFTFGIKNLNIPRAGKIEVIFELDGIQVNQGTVLSTKGNQ